MIRAWINAVSLAWSLLNALAFLAGIVAAVWACLSRAGEEEIVWGNRLKPKTPPAITEPS